MKKAVLCRVTLLLFPIFIVYTCLT
jgi:hypothetical protein